MDVPLFLKKLAFLAGIILVLANLFYLGVYVRNQIAHALPVHFEPGTQFEMAREYLTDVKAIGYLTSKDISREKNDGMFLQAQYYLAPVLVELQADDHGYFILDSEDVPYIISTMRRLNAVRLTNNEYGQALIKKSP